MKDIVKMLFVKKYFQGIFTRKINILLPYKYHARLPGANFKFKKINQNVSNKTEMLKP